MSSFTYPAYDFRPPDELKTGAGSCRVAVVGGGLVGVTMALDLAQRGIPVVVLDDDNTVSQGSRSICQAKRSLEIWDRLGVADTMMAKGVTWNEGQVFHGGTELYRFNLQDQPDSKFPAFINLQQYYVEQYLIDAALSAELIDLRWQNKVVDVSQGDDHAIAKVETPDGAYDLKCDWLIGADGVRSTVRQALGLQFTGEIFQDHFLIADIRMDFDAPAVRRFWFDPDWGPEQSALMHKQADDVWRLDFQLGWDIDRDEEIKPENVTPRVRRMIGEDVPFEFEWISIYTFQCRRLEKFRQGRVLFIGDAAHQVSPFGARGGNTGVQDVDNLAWKLALVIGGDAPDKLLDSFDAERVYAARDAIMNSTRATDFITPKSPVHMIYRDAVLEMARDHPFARDIVNAGRLSVPVRLHNSPLNSFDSGFAGEGVPLGLPPPSVPIEAQFEEGEDITHLPHLLGSGFALLYFAETEDDLPAPMLSGLVDLRSGSIPLTTYLVSPLKNGARDLLGVFDRLGLAAAAFAAEPGTAYLFRPDQHVCARWRQLDINQLNQALQAATAHTRSPVKAGREA